TLFRSKGQYFFYAGRMAEEKGVGVLLEAFGGASGRLVLAGEGPRLGDYQKRAEGKASIRFAGRLDSGTLKQYYRDCIAVVVPSLWYENASMTVLEAMAFGKPVVASR